jgi:hypothetical protein
VHSDIGENESGLAFSVASNLVTVARSDGRSVVDGQDTNDGLNGDRAGFMVVFSDKIESGKVLGIKGVLIRNEKNSPKWR